MLSHNVIGKSDQPVVYASRLLNKAKHNYSTTKRKTLVVVFALHKFKHYLFSNKFVFYVDHMALVYLVNKPWVSGRITKWLLFFLEYDSTIMYKVSKAHVVANALSRLLDIIEPISVFDQTIDANLFYTKLEWLKM
jgi:hypothetical protein